MNNPFKYKEAYSLFNGILESYTTAFSYTFKAPNTDLLSDSAVDDFIENENEKVGAKRKVE